MTAARLINWALAIYCAASIANTAIGLWIVLR